MTSHKRFFLAAIIFLLTPFLGAQQRGIITLNANSVRVIDDSMKFGENLSEYWKFHNGDSMAWASPEYNDAVWDSMKTSFLLDSLPQGRWSGIGWFRVKLMIDPSLRNKMVAFSIFQDGASEFYLDGKLLKKYGVVSTGKNEVTFDPKRLPFGVYLDSSSVHTLAVRYSNTFCEQRRNIFKVYTKKPGFSLRISELDETYRIYNRNDDINTIIQVSLSGLIFALGLIHLLIYFFHRKEKAHLHYSNFAFSVVFMVVSGLIFKYFTQSSSYNIFSVVNILTVLVIFLFLLRFLYTINYGKIIKFFWVIAVLALITFVSGFVQKSDKIFDAFLILTIVLASIEGLRIVVLGIKKKLNGSWIIGIGFFGFFALVTFVLAVNVFGKNNYVSLEFVLFILYSGFLSIPLSMSIFLARSFALTNQNLETKLVEVKLLSEKTIEQERKEAEMLLLREKEQLKLRESELRAEALEKENERKAKELEQARQIQLSMLPTKIPQLPNLDIAVYMKTATEVGGDYYDFFVDSQRKMTLVIGDATGHGVKAGIMVTAVKSLFSAYVDELTLLDMFKRFNRGIKEMNLGALYMCFSALKIKEYEMEYSNAGMPPMLVYRTASKQVETVSLKAMPLGAFADFPYQETSLSFLPGDTVLLLSDGFPELFSKKREMIDYPQVEKYFLNVAEKTPQAIIDYFVKVVKDWREDDSLEDDVTFVVLKFK